MRHDQDGGDASGLALPTMLLPVNCVPCSCRPEKSAPHRPESSVAVAVSIQRLWNKRPNCWPSWIRTTMEDPVDAMDGHEEALALSRPKAKQLCFFVCFPLRVLFLPLHFLRKTTRPEHHHLGPRLSYSIFMNSSFESLTRLCPVWLLQTLLGQQDGPSNHSTSDRW